MDTKVDLHRFDEQLTEIDAILKTRPPQENGVLLYGSSTMANWRKDDMCYTQLAPLPITNTGFGGSTAEEALYYYHRLVVPARPAVMAYYEGANDLMNKYTPEEVIETTRRLFDWAKQDFPGIRFLIVPIKLSPGLDHIREEGERCNAMFEQFANERDDTEVVDMDPLLYDANGEHRDDIYVEDKLHHNQKGYEELAAILKPRLIEALEKRS